MVGGACYSFVVACVLWLVQVGHHGATTGTQAVLVYSAPEVWLWGGGAALHQLDWPVGRCRALLCGRPTGGWCCCSGVSMVAMRSRVLVLLLPPGEWGHTAEVPRHPICCGCATHHVPLVQFVFESLTSTWEHHNFLAPPGDVLNKIGNLSFRSLRSIWKLSLHHHHW